MIMLALAVGTMLSGGDEGRIIFAIYERNLYTHRNASGNLVGKGSGGVTSKSSFLLQKPKSFRLIDDQINMYSDGKVQFNYLIPEKEYFKRDVSRGFGFGSPCALDSFFGSATGSSAPYFVKKTEFRMQKLDGRECAAKALHFESFGRDDRMVFYVDRATRQMLGWDQVFGGRKMYYRFVNLRFDVDVPKDAFEWKPPPGIKERVLRHG